MELLNGPRMKSMAAMALKLSLAFLAVVLLLEAGLGLSSKYHSYWQTDTSIMEAEGPEQTK